MIAAVLVAVSFVVRPAVAADYLRILTEDYPPFNFKLDNGEIGGLSTEIVRRILSKADLDYDLVMLPWKRAYKETQRDANTCLYSTAETPERADQFRWVGPIIENDWVLFALKERPVTIVDLADLKSLRVGGYVGDAITTYLQDRGVTVDAAQSEAQNLKKLLGGRIDVWPTGRVIGRHIATQEGKADAIKEVYRLRKVRVSMACNLNTNDALIQRLRDALAGLRVTGELDMLQSEIF